MAEHDALTPKPAPLSLGWRLGCWVLYILIGCLSCTWRVRRLGSEEVTPAGAPEPVVYAFWHGQQLMMVPTHRGRGIVGLASLSRDGSLLARVIELFGYSVVRGSSSRGGNRALKACLEAMAAGLSPGVAVDGPRGPRGEPHAGAVVMAARSGRPIVYVVGRCAWKIRLKSWDRFEIPGPFARVDLVYGELSPPGGSRQDIEDARRALRERMLEAGRAGAAS